MKIDTLPNWLHRLFSANIYGIGKSSSDGNCLFDSIRMTIIYNKPNFLLTNENLREIVANSVLNINNKITSSTLKIWKELLIDGIRRTDFKQCKEYQQAYPLLYDKYPYKLKTRKKVYDMMMSPSHYWGDEYVIRCLESHLPIQCYVFIPSNQHYSISYPLRSELKSLNQTCKNRIKVYLVLENEHYRPVLALLPKN